MKHTLYKEADYKTSEHMGGTARELAVFPATAEYLNRDFIWRISVDSIESEESDFSRLPDYGRVLLILEGETDSELRGSESCEACAIGAGQIRRVMEDQELRKDQRVQSDGPQGMRWICGCHLSERRKQSSVGSHIWQQIQYDPRSILRRRVLPHH